MENLGLANLPFWRGRRVFLTGHTGFKGAWLALWLARLGAQVTGYALAPPTTPSLFESAGVGHKINSIIGDIRDRQALEPAIQQSRPEVVFHLAAQSLVLASFEDPLDTYSVNLMGTLSLLQALRITDSVRAAVIVTSDKCYAAGSRQPFKESDTLGGDDPYSSSKACAEIAAGAWRTSFLRDEGPAIATARAGNVIGGGDWAAHRLVPDCVHAFASGEPVALRNPQAVRPWQHVLEPLAGYLCLAERLCADRSAAAAWNFGPDASAERPAAWVAETLAALWGPDASWRPVDAPRNESAYLSLDSRKARDGLGWRPKLAIESSLAWTVDWFKGFAAGTDARELTVRQIAAYEALGG